MKRSASVFSFFLFMVFVNATTLSAALIRTTVDSTFVVVDDVNNVQWADLTRFENKTFAEVLTEIENMNTALFAGAGDWHLASEAEFYDLLDEIVTVGDARQFDVTDVVSTHSIILGRIDSSGSVADTHNSGFLEYLTAEPDSSTTFIDKRVVTNYLDSLSSDYVGAFVVSSLSAELTNQKLISPGLNVYEKFGTVVAIDGDLAVIGAPASNVLYNDTPGKAYLYQRDSNGEWHNVHTFLPSVTNDTGQPPEFGSAVAISGDTVVIGARRTHIGDDLSAGCAYIFSADGSGGWSEQIIHEPDIGSTDWFGESVAISDEIIIIGSLRSGYNLGRPGLSGAAYVYTKTGGTWNYAATLLASDPEYGASFGNAVAVEGTTAVVGARYWGPSSTGAVYVFEADPDDLSIWEQSTRITSSETSNQFGWSVALSNDRIAVGSYQPGYVEIFERANVGPDNWGSVQFIDAGYYNQTFGYSLDLENNQLLIGAPLNSEIASGAGSVHLYKHNGTSVGHQWNEVEIFYPQNDTVTPYNARFGNSVALSGYTLLVGASEEDIKEDETTYGKAGSAYIISTLPLLGDIDNDGNIDLADTILALKAISNLTHQPIYKRADINDGKIGLEEAVYTLQVTAEKRP